MAGVVAAYVCREERGVGMSKPRKILDLAGVRVGLRDERE
jgi:hypothetical protein